MTTRNSPLRINELSRITRTLFRQHHHGVGLFVLIATLFVLSFLAGLQPPMQFRVFMAGEVADSDVVAHRSLTVEDTEAAKIKRNQVAMLQPTVFDLSVTEIAALRQKIFGMLKLINGQETSPEAQDALRASLAEKLATPVSSDLLAQWMSPEVQEYVLSTGLPWFEDRLREGVVGDVRLALPSKNGIIVRDVDTKAETLRPDVSDIRDVPAVLAAFTQKLRSAEKLTPQGRRAVLVLFSPLIMPTLTLNREATQALGNAVAQTVEPVYYHIQKGEVVVYQGERVTREKQLKLQSLYQKQEGLIHSRTVAGTFVFSLILTLGLFMAPSGKPGTPAEKGLFVHLAAAVRLRHRGERHLHARGQGRPAAGHRPRHPLLPRGGRRGAVRAHLRGPALLRGGPADIPVRLRHAQGRPSAVFVLLPFRHAEYMARHPGAEQAGRGHRHHPLALGQIIIALGSGWLEGFRGGNTFLWLFGIVSLNAFISIAILFAISPIIEMAFRYTTRFRLMELMNLEQPLLRISWWPFRGPTTTRWSSPTWWRPEPRPWARTACCARSRPCTTTSASWPIPTITSKTSSTAPTGTTSWLRP